jgi:NADH:ubiquinone oxidoreductase subunit E
VSPARQELPAGSRRTAHIRPAHIIRMCTLVPCYADADAELARAIGARLGIGMDERTADGAIGFEVLDCIGLCDIPASVLIDDEPVVGQEAVLDAIDELVQGER